MNEDEPLDEVSDISEMPVTFAAGHFLAALCWGTLSGMGVIIAALIIGSGFDFDLDDISYAIGILGVVGLFVAGFTFAGLVIIGLPLTLVLRRMQMESAALYASIGAITGFLILVTIFAPHDDPLELAFSLIGAVAGGASAYRWGRWRDAIAEHRESKTPNRRTNPIHDLTH